MAHPLIETARKAPLKIRQAAMRRAQDQVKNLNIKEAKKRAASGKSNWGTKYRGLASESEKKIPGFKHYADGVQRRVDNRVHKR